MIETLQTLFGLGAIVFTSTSFIPQVWKSWKTKSVDDISWLMVIIHILANLCWLGYGIIIVDAVIVITDSLVLTMLMILSAIKFKYQTEPS